MTTRITEAATSANPTEDAKNQSLGPRRRGLSDWENPAKQASLTAGVASHMAPWIFEDLPTSMADRLQSAGFVGTLKAGETLYVEGAKSDRLSKVSPNGNQGLVAVR
jgi:hypothetical protein